MRHSSVRKNSYLTLSDQFCGAGGSSIGATSAGVEVKYAWNHWRLAVETHNTNFPNVSHDCADMSAVDPRRYRSTDILITSPECTNHSLAKGKKRQMYREDLFGNVLVDPADERSRATMWDVPRFAEYHNYRIIVVENVVDAAHWVMWDSWLHAMHALGYDHEVVYYNSMFAHPTPQSRDRLYTVFWKRGNKKPDLEFRPLAYCPHCEKNVQTIQTFKKRVKWGRYKFQYYYRCEYCGKDIMPYHYAGFNAIDFSIPSVRIGDRAVPLKPKTLERIKYGFDAYGKQMMIITGRYTSGVECRVRNANSDPIPTQPGDASHAVLLPWMIETAHSAHSAGSTSQNGSRVKSSVESLSTQTSAQTLAVVTGFLSKQYGGAADPKRMGVSLDQSLGTITTVDHHALIHGDLKFTKDIKKLKEGDLLSFGDKEKRHSLLQASSFLSYYYGTHQASGMADAIRTMTSKEHAALISGGGEMRLEDLYFRMLAPREIGSAMAFPSKYVVLGNNKEQVKQYGNAVTPPVMEMIIKRCVESLS